MSQLVIMVLDVVSDTPENHTQLLKRGDVIDVLPDGAHPGTETLRLPPWRILLVPDLTETEASPLLANEQPEGFIIGERDYKGPGHFGLKIRALGLDLEHPAISSEMAAWLEDFTQVSVWDAPHTIGKRLVPGRWRQERRQPCWTCGADLIRQITIRKPRGPQTPVTIASRARVVS